MQRRRFITALIAVPAAFAAKDSFAEIPVDVIEDKIRGGLLGEMLGDLNGLKHEMKYIDEPGNVVEYTPALPDGGWTDDDTDIEWVYILEIERSGTLMVPPARINELWQRHINRAIWCSHLFLRQLMDLGIEPPLTGSTHLNPWADFNLSGQFVSETWGLIAPGMPRTAAQLGTYYTHVSIEGEATQSTALFSTMISTAYLTRDMNWILDAGVAALDPKSIFRQIVADVRRWRKENPQDWRATRKQIQQKYRYFGGHDMRDRNGVQLNGAATVAALLYGHGDFVETVRHAFNFGWDCDNNAATSGTILGVIKGYKWLSDQQWKIADRFRNTSRDQMPDDETITSFGSRVVSLADKVIRAHGGEKTTSGGKAVYRIRTETPVVAERLPDPAKELEALKTKLHPQVAHDIAASDPQSQARAAYLAVCLDFAPALRSAHPDQWSKAIAALSAGYPKMLRVLFYQSPIPAAETLQKKALAAGIEAPPKTK